MTRRQRVADQVHHAGLDLGFRKDGIDRLWKPLQRVISFLLIGALSVVTFWAVE
jgi:hypothetical protein